MAARELKTNTAVIVVVGPFFDKTDGVTLKTALTITNEKITLTAETDNGSAPTLILDNIAGAVSGTSNDLNYITNCDAGLMQMELSAANVNRLGRMRLVITDSANHVPVWEDFEIVSAQYFAAKYGTGNFSADAKAVGGTTQTGRDLGASVLLSVGTGAGQVNVSSGKVPATIAAGDIATDAITADALKADAATEIAHALLDHILSAHLTSGTVGESLASYPGKKVVVSNQLIQYAANNTTELFRFNLFAADGSTPTMTDVYYAVRV